MLIFYFLSLILANPIDVPTQLPKFTSSRKYFIQSDPTIPYSSNLNNFGLYHNYTWTSLLNELQDFPDSKLFIIQRHGQGYHNIAPDLFTKSEWDCYWQFQSGSKGIVWEDAELTTRGIHQVESLSANINSTVDFPHPQQFYVSPLRRTLQTWQLTWKNMTNNTAMIKEFARETYGMDTESKRHNKTYTSCNFPGLAFEPGFNESDGLWGHKYRENSQQRKLRASALLNDIFTSEAKVIGLVSHSNLLSSLLEVIEHRSWSLPTGGMIPVVITRDQSETVKYQLDLPWLTFRDLCKYNNYSDPLVNRAGKNTSMESSSVESTSSSDATSSANQGAFGAPLCYNWVAYLLALAT
ncbi:uncharacterized protein SPAPADRAFT_64947 [Spathaspora passalidarum NRRL Y-27907]|uniref:Phosphoglycerate mutase-like protein n=1 Tax=Spathaspora passalidarum (strain NRRL Y-27907 / 11-Y1) TaxID=619300 RepID=G3AIJ7_SPAPN|nr:uncharacterized protein SPAPADRAFT_64947 [Spathaspora passalidarum NRRL Y-27907]EGW33712.1 hypothetical protein SPAPADRAFT_64947 [Spathaspora passalidarum NRRL Y-27907]